METRAAARLAGLVSTRLWGLQETKPRHQLQFRVLGDALEHETFHVFAVRLDWKVDEESKNINYIVLTLKSENDETHPCCTDTPNVFELCAALYVDLREALSKSPEETDERYSRLLDLLQGTVDDYRLVLYAPHEIPPSRQATVERSRSPFVGVFVTTKNSVYCASENDANLHSALMNVDDTRRRQLISHLILVNTRMKEHELDDLLKTALKGLLWQQKQDWVKVAAIVKKYLSFLQVWWQNKSSLLSEPSTGLLEIVRNDINMRYQCGECGNHVLDDLRTTLKSHDLSYIIIPETPNLLRCSRLKQVILQEDLRYLIVSESTLKEWQHYIIEKLSQTLCDELVLCVASVDYIVRGFIGRVQSNPKCRVRIITPSWVEEVYSFFTSLDENCNTWTEYIPATQKHSSLPLPLKRLRGSATTHGPSYEFKLAALLALRARHAGLKFRLYTNVEAARPWDDLVLRVDAPRPVVYLLQLKHAREGGSVSTKAFLEDEDGDYSLSKYFEWFRSFQEKFDQRDTLADQDEWLLCSWKDDLRFVIYTNRKVEQTSSPSATNAAREFPFENLLVTGDAANIFSFQDGDEVCKLFNDDLHHTEFLPRLRVLGSQAHVDGLDSLMRRELNSMYGKPLKRADKYVDQYNKRFQHWAEKSSSGTCVTESSGELEEVIAKDLRERAREGTEDLFIFKEEQCSALRDALPRCGIVHLTVPGVSPGHRVAKLQQVLDKEFPDKWAYVDGKILMEFPQAALEAACAVCDAIVFDVERKTKAFQDLFAAITGRVKLAVLLSDSSKEKKATPGQEQPELTDNWALEHLTEEAQETILDRPLEFQETALQLRDLQASWPSLRRDVDGVLLSKLVLGDAAMGQAPPVDDDVMHHLPRTVGHMSALSREVLRLSSPSEHLVLYGFTREELEQLKNELPRESRQDSSKMWKPHDKLGDRWTVLEEVESTSTLVEKFQRECALNPLRNVHLVENVNGSLFWKASQGKTTAMADLVLPTSAKCTPPYEPECQHEYVCVRETATHGGVVRLLLGEPGIGKSSFLRGVAARARASAPTQWAVMVKLLDHDDLLENMPEPKDMKAKDVLDLVAAAAGVAAPHSGAARRSVEAALLHSGAIHVFVDGVDEVVPAHKDKALRLLELLRQMKVADLWVASRPEVHDSLHRVLRCASLSLLPLSRCEQLSYLSARWASDQVENSGDAIEDLAKEMVEAFAHIPGRRSQQNAVGPNQFLGLPVAIVRELFNVLNHATESQVSTESFRERVEEAFATAHFRLMKENGLAVSRLVEETIEEFMKTLNQDNREKNVIAVMKAEKQEVVKNIVDQYENRISRRSLLAVPLHLRMAAEAYAEKVNDALLSGESFIRNRISQLDLFALFIKDKRKRCKEQYGINRVAMKNTNFAMEDDNMFHRVHQDCAMLIWSAGLPEEYRHQLQKNNIKYREYITKEKTGIVRYSEDGGLQFAHYTFLEYFAAAWMYENYKNSESGGTSKSSKSIRSSKQFLRAAFERKWISDVLFFFDLMLADELLLHNAILLDDEESLKTALATNERSDRLDQGGRSALHLAASYGRVGALEALLGEGSNFKQRDAVLKWTPLEYADAALELEAAEKLLERGADAEQLDSIVRTATDHVRGASVVMRAAQHDLVEIMRKLLTSRARNSVINGFIRNDLQIEYGPPKHEQGSHQDVTANQLGITVKGYPEAPIHLASFSGRTKIVKLLLKVGVDVNHPTRWRQTPLHLAASEGHQDIVKLLLGAGANIDAGDERNITPLLVAASRRHKSVVQILLREGARVDACTEQQVTPLLWVASEGGTDIMQLLMSYNADVNKAMQDGLTPLHFAAVKDHKDIVELLLRGGALVNVGDKDDNIPLHAAAQEGREGVVKILLSHNAEVNKATRNGDTALHFAASRGHFSVAEILLQNGASVDACDNNNCSPLHAAMPEGREDMTKLLLSFNADVNKAVCTGATALHIAAGNGHHGVAKILIHGGALVDGCDDDNHTPLYAAAQEGKEDVVKLLLSHNADVNKGTRNGATALHIAAAKGHRAISEILLQSGACVDACDADNCTPLCAAAQEGGEDVVKLLMSYNANVNKTTRRGQTALLAAAMEGHEAIAEILLQAGALVDSCDEENHTSLYGAAQEGREGVVKLLLAHDADVNKASHNGATALHIAAAKGHQAISEILLQSGACVNACNSENCTPLHWASQEGKVDTVKVLLSRNADVNKTSECGTPLHFAARNGHKETVEVLLQKGACVEARDAQNKTPVLVAASQGHKEVVALIVSWIRRLSTSSE